MYALFDYSCRYACNHATIWCIQSCNHTLGSNNTIVPYIAALEYVCAITYPYSVTDNGIFSRIYTFAVFIQDRMSVTVAYNHFSGKQTVVTYDNFAVALTYREETIY